MRKPPKSITLSKAVEGFLLFRRAEGISPHTIHIYRWTFARLSEFLDEADPELAALNHEKLQSFYLWLQVDYLPHRKNGMKQPLSPSSIEKAWSTLRSFYNWAEKELRLERADSSLRRPKYQPREISPLNLDEIKALLKHCAYTRESKTQGRNPFTMRRDTAHRDEALLLLLLDTGLRVSECARLRVKDINTSTGEIFVDSYGSGQKTKSRHVYLGQKALKAVWRYLSERDDLIDEEPLFQTRSGTAMDKDSIRLVLVELGSRAGVKNVHPHGFRHTFAIEYLRNHGDVFTLQRILGHSTLTMVQHYLQIASADVHEAHRKASPADHWHL